MKIIIDIRSLADSHLTGVGEYTLHLTKNLLKLCPEHEFFLFYNSAKKYEIKYFKDFSNAKIVKFNYSNKLFNLGIMSLKIPKLDQLVCQKANIDKADIFFAPNINFVSLSKHCRLIITAHDLSYILYPEFFSWKHKLWHSAVNSKRLFNQASKVIAVSDNTKQDLQTIFKLPESKIQIIYSGLATPSEGESQLKLPSKFILGLSTIEPRKNSDSLLKAFVLLKKQYPNLPHKLVLAGGKGWKSKPVFNLIDQINLQFDEQQVFYLKYINQTQKAALYQKADLFVYPSIYEGFGFPPLEAMQQKTPVISSYSSSLSEVMQNAAIYIDPYNLADITQAMYQVLTNQSLAEYYQDLGYTQIRKFDWQKAARQLLNIFET